MANELATRNSGAVANTGGASGNPFLSAASTLGGGDSGTFLKFSGKNGDYTYGADQEELDDGWKGAVDINQTAKRGHICWKDGNVVGEDMTLVVDGNPTPKSLLEDHGPYDDEEDGWSEQFSVELVELESGEQMLLKNSSKSGLRAFGALLNAYGKAIQKGQNIGEDGDELVPVVEFSATEFTPKNSKSKKDRAYAPSFKIVDWISHTELQEQFGGEDDASNYEEDEPKEEKKPVKKTTEAAAKPAKKVKEEEVEDAVAEDVTEEDEAPADTGRRRRRF